MCKMMGPCLHSSQFECCRGWHLCALPAGRDKSGIRVSLNLGSLQGLTPHTGHSRVALRGSQSRWYEAVQEARAGPEMLPLGTHTLAALPLSDKKPKHEEAVGRLEGHTAKLSPPLRFQPTATGITCCLWEGATQTTAQWGLQVTAAPPTT